MNSAWKRQLIGLGLVLFVFFYACDASRASEAAVVQKCTPTPPASEQYRYDIAFLWFDRIAEAELSLQPAEEPNRWQATLEAKTRGVAAWITSDRAQHNASLMQLEDKGFFTSLRYDSNILKTKDGQKRSRLKSYLFDHQQQHIIQRVNRNGRQKEDVILPMPQEAPNDLLTAFYNFRHGVFGPVVEGAKYHIPTYNSKGPNDIVVEVLGIKQRPRRPKFPKQGLLLKVQINKETFDTDNGIVYVWLDEQGRPAQVVVEDVIGLGDVRGTLQKKGP
ncbi:MAG: hypothetical protein BA870_00080 [Desulfuromonadales bacterium C00003094]|jgi:hypothetical protein|nr:MAG: hypothetical protein BA870_00080 [Desulfuromonadales bacterium C00003094]OEU72499.1 MAG: hypothetical protein BA869_10555 [Desulfuromonadales bacterium C00003107]